MYLEWYLKEQAAGEKTLEETVVELLAEKGFHITTAESCTGGMIAGTLVNVAGASEVLNEGYVTYSNEAKERLLGVASETISDYGVVSRQTAAEMAAGAAKTAHTTIALSSTGVAGPDGGTKEHPVGDVYLGCCYNGSVMTQHMLGCGSRTEIRQQAVAAAFSLLEKMLTEEKIL